MRKRGIASSTGKILRLIGSGSRQDFRSLTLGQAIETLDEFRYVTCGRQVEALLKRLEAI